MLMPITDTESFWLEEQIEKFHGIYSSVHLGQRLVDQFVQFTITGIPVSLEFVAVSQMVFLERFRRIVKSQLAASGYSGELEKEAEERIFGANVAKAAMLTNFLLESQEFPEGQFKVALGAAEAARWESMYGAFPGVHKLSATSFQNVPSIDGPGGPGPQGPGGPPSGLPPGPGGPPRG